jgi:glycosyltransferase involved in cell wall biosynthesis
VEQQRQSSKIIDAATLPCDRPARHHEFDLSEPHPTTRIAFCITDLDAGGAERALVQLVTRLNRERWLPRVFSLSAPGELVATLEDSGIEVTSLGLHSAWNIPRLWRLVRGLRRFRPQIVQTFLHHANIAGRFAAKIAGVPHVVSGIRVAEKRSRGPLRLDRWTNFLVERNVCVSEGVRQFAETSGGLDPAKSVVIPNGVDVDAIRSADAVDLWKFGIPGRNRTLLWIGRLEEQKDPMTFLQAAEPLFGLYADMYVLVIGEGPLRSELENWVRDKHLEKRVLLPGRQADVAGLMQAAFAFVLSSRWEGMPNVVLEAMAAAKPVVATNVEGLGELIRHGGTGFLVRPERPAEMSAVLTGLLDDPEAASQIGVAAQQYVCKEFTWTRATNLYERLYEDLLGLPTGDRSIEAD